MTAAREYHPDATVVFIGANEGFPLRGADGRKVSCCGAQWAAAYANRARAMTATYRRGGAGRVYWIAVPALRDARRTAIGRVINQAVAIAIEPWRRQVRQLDAGAIFTPTATATRCRSTASTPSSASPTGCTSTTPARCVLAQAISAQLLADFTLPDA